MIAFKAYALETNCKGNSYENTTNYCKRQDEKLGKVTERLVLKHTGFINREAEIQVGCLNTPRGTTNPPFTDIKFELKHNFTFIF